MKMLLEAKSEIGIIRQISTLKIYTKSVIAKNGQ